MDTQNRSVGTKYFLEGHQKGKEGKSENRDTGQATIEILQTTHIPSVAMIMDISQLNEDNPKMFSQIISGTYRMCTCYFLRISDSFFRDTML